MIMARGLAAKRVLLVESALICGTSGSAARFTSESRCTRQRVLAEQTESSDRPWNRLSVLVPCGEVYNCGQAANFGVVRQLNSVFGIRASELVEDRRQLCLNFQHSGTLDFMGCHLLSSVVPPFSIANVRLLQLPCFNP